MTKRTGKVIAIGVGAGAGGNGQSEPVAADEEGQDLGIKVRFSFFQIFPHSPLHRFRILSDVIYLPARR